MAGYLITLDSEEALKECMESGLYSTRLSEPRNSVWSLHHEGTFADYLSMKEGDLIFFFIKRKIYGCGKLVNIGEDCKYLNYNEALNPRVTATDYFFENHLIECSTQNNKCFCIFEPYPVFFRDGIDMDEVLQYRTSPFRSIRTLWKLSFIKMDNDEAKALFDIFIKHNADNLADSSYHYDFSETVHERLSANDLTPYRMKSSDLIKTCTDDTKHSLKHEMAIEAVLCDLLCHEGIEPFGKWDYISHQVAASPMKPVDYIDKMDVFGYKYIEGYDVIGKYLIIEIKKDMANSDVVEQILKYADWVANEYANGDYSMIEAYIVALDFENNVQPLVEQYGKRNFTKGYRPTQFCEWSDIKLVKYSSNGEMLTFCIENN